MDFASIYTQLKTSFEEASGYPVQDDSDLGIRMKVMAGELYHLSEQIELVKRQMFPQSATGEYLEHHGACRDLYKKPAAAARGTLRFSRSTAASQDIVIPAGTLCAASSAGNAVYLTEEAGVLLKGQTSVDIPGVASEVGPGGNMLAGKIDTIMSAVAGISAVTNPFHFSGGMEEESDESFRKRLLDSFVNTSNGANAKFYQDFALRYDRVLFANTEYVEDGNTLNLYVSDYFRMTDSDLIAQIQADIQAEKELNVNVVVKAAEPVTQNVSATIYVTETQNTGQRSGDAINYLSEKIYQLGIGEAFNPYSIAHDITEKLDGVFGISFEQPSTLVEVDAGEIIQPGLINVSVACI